MAGSYPDPPAARMAYDRDGTQMFKISAASVVTQNVQGDLNGWNSESLSGALTFGTGGGGYELVVFPELRDLTALAIGFVNSGIVSMQTSVDTTNGIDGTWVTRTTPTTAPLTREGMRTSITSVSYSGIKAIRFGCTGGLSFFAVYYMHLYGVRSAVTDRLEFWHPTLDQSLSVTPAHLDWGNRPRNTSADKQFRIKNRSGALTASSIVVGMEAPTDASPTYVSQHQFSLDGINFSPTVVIGSLAPGAVSPVVTVRQTLLSSAALSVWTQRIYANVGTWT